MSHRLREKTRPRGWLGRPSSVICTDDSGSVRSTKKNASTTIWLGGPIDQCRAARALIDMSQSVLAVAAMVPATVIVDFETGAWIRPADLEALQSALERAGIEFTNGDQPGVRPRKGGK
jgi:hypothetical protein